MNGSKGKTKAALLLNIIAPSRIRLYSLLADHFDLLILHGGTEANRDSWSNLDRQLPNAQVVRAWGWQMRYAKKMDGEVFDEKFIHITPGFAWGLLRFRPQAVISNEMGVRTLIALAYGTLFRKPVWVWWGGTLHTERANGRLRNILRKIISRWAKHWISYGQTSTEYLLHLGIPRERILESQNTIDEQQFQRDGGPLWSVTPRPVVLFTGQFIERKGLGSLLNAAAVVQRQGLDFSLLLVGSGRDKQALEDKAKSLSLKNVLFRPAQTPDKMPSVYRSGDVLIFPTREDVWGLVANEAVLSGVPVLCSKYAGCAPELFSPEDIFDPENADEFAGKLRDVVAGKLPKLNPTRIRGIAEVANRIIFGVEDSLGNDVHAGRPVESEQLK
jgi:glycosyltransferase involved in cell wall biosynthesis